MKHLPIEILRKIRDMTANKIIDLTINYNGDMKTYKKLEALYNNLYKICDTMEEKTGKYEADILSKLDQLPKIFVVDAKPIKYDINYDVLKGMTTPKRYYTPEEVSNLLMWTVNNTRDILRKDNDTNNLMGLCGPSQFYSLYPLAKLGLKITINKAGSIDSRMGGHGFGTVTIPTLIGNNIENRQYLIDCTYSQFFHLDRCVENMYKSNGRKPDAGYFIKDYRDEELFVSNMIKYGFCEASENNLKKYFYGMYLSCVEKENIEEEIIAFNNKNISNIISTYQGQFDCTEEEFKKWENVLDIRNSYYGK